MEIRTSRAKKEMLRPIRGKQATRDNTLKVNTKEQKEYTAASGRILAQWLKRTDNTKLEWKENKAEQEIINLIRELTLAKRGIAGVTIPKEYRTKRGIKDRKQKNLDEALRAAVKANKEQPHNRQNNRMLWTAYKEKQQQRQEERANEEQNEQDRRAMKTEQAWKEKREEQKWTQREEEVPRRDPTTVTTTYFDKNEKHIHGKEEVMEHINKEVNSMANPEQVKAKEKEHQDYENHIRKEVKKIQKESKGIQDWEPQQEDTETIINYMADAHRARTSPGIDGITPDTFIFAHELMEKAIHRILQIIATRASK